MKKGPVLVLALALSIFLAQEAESQVDLGAQALYNVDITDGAFGIGARAEFTFPVVGLGATGDFNWYFPDTTAGDLNYWEGVAHVSYSLIPLSPASPYVGGGLAYQRTSTDAASASDVGLTVLGGVELGGVSPIGGYGEVSYRLMQDFANQVVLAVGVLF